MAATFVPLVAQTGEGASFVASWPPRPPLPPEPSASPGVSPEAVLAAAREQAEVILADARQQAAALAADQAERARQEQLAAFRQASESCLTALRRDWDLRLDELEVETVQLVTVILRRLLGDHFSAEPDSVIPVVREALQALSDNARVEVVVAPAHAAAVRQAQADLAALLSAEARLTVTVDDELGLGDCLVHGEQGSLDARLETRLELVAEALDKALAQRAAGDDCS